MCSDGEGITRVCAKCSRELGEGQRVRLWDGKDYCRACILDASPKLAMVAERFSALSERIAVNPREALREELRVCCLVGLFFLGLCCLEAWQQGFPLTVALLVVGVVIVPLMLLRGSGAYANARRVSGRVVVENGYVRLEEHWISKWLPRFALSQCRWYSGKLSRRETILIPKGVHTRRKVVILEYTLKVGFFPMRVRIPCGLTDEMRELWEAFLTLAGVERKPRRRWWALWKRLRSRRNKSPKSNTP